MPIVRAHDLRPTLDDVPAFPEVLAVRERARNAVSLAIEGMRQGTD
jgi:hypothetical protein